MRKCVLSVLVLLLMISTYTAYSDRAQISLPPRWPKQVCVGFANYDTIAALKDYKKSAGIEILSSYLNGGFTSGWAMQYGFWTGAPGAHLTGKITEYAKQDVIPAFTYYQLLDAATTTGTERQKDLATINNASTMAKYWQDVKYFLTYAGQFPEQLIILHIEPDFWGFCQQEGLDNGIDWTTLPAKVAGSGDSDLAGLPNTIDGFAKGLKRLRDNMAPNVLLAFHMSFWTSGLHKRYYEYNDAELKAGGQQSASLFNMLTPSFDLIFTEVSDGDSVWDKIHNSVDTSRLWTENEFLNYNKYMRAFTDNVHLPVVLWQIAPGNVQMRSMNNTDKHYQSNFAEHYFGWMWDQQLNALLDSGVVGYIFESHAFDTHCTRIYDWANDGVTNPTPVNGNNTFTTETPPGSVQYYDGGSDTLYTPYASDDDGGYLRWRTYEYHTHVGVPIVFEPDIEIKAQNEMVIYPGETQPSLDNDTVFDLAMVGKNTVDRTYILKNKGTVDLTLTGGKITISGPQSSDFYVVGTPDAIIPPRSNTNFTIRFQPTGVGERNATVTITSTDPDKTAYSFAIRGNGLSSNFHPTDISGCKLWADATQITGVSDGARVDTWQDLSGNYNNLTKEAQSPSLGAVYKTNGQNGLPVLRFNADASYDMNAEITDIRTVFWMVKEDSGYTGGAFLLGDIFNHFDYSRDGNGGANPPIWDSIYASDKIKLGQTRLNGTLIDGTATKMPTDFSVISVITTGNTRASRVQRDRGHDKLWKGEWGELIIYNKPLDWNEMRSVEIYLENKWLRTFNPVPEIAVHGNGSDITDGDTQPSTGDGTDYGSISISATADQTFSIYNSGTGQLTISTPTITGANAGDFSIKTQPSSTVNAGFSTNLVITFQPSSPGVKNATVTIPNSDSDEGNFTFAIKGFGVSSNRGKGPVGTVNCIAWFDASDIDGDGTDEGLAENGVNADGSVADWFDKSENGNDALPNGTDSAPILAVNSQNGLTTLKDDGVAFLKFNELSDIRTVFWVVKENDISSSHFLLGHDSDYAFHRGIKADTSPDGFLWDEQYSAPEVYGGSTYLDQVLIDGTTTSLPVGDYHLISLVTTGSVKANQITRDRSYSGRSWKGNIAEIIIYNSVLSDTDRTAVENYLKGKWLTQQARYTLTVNDGSGSGQYTAGTSVNVIATTAPTGKVFDKWTGDTSGISDIYSESATYTMPSQDAALTATYKISVSNTYDISGTITGDLVSGIMITIDSTHSATSDASGNYTITGMVDGTYTLIASFSGYTFSPSSQVITVAGADVGGVNFNSTKNTSAAVNSPTDIAGCVVWYDGSDPAGDGSTVTVSTELTTWVDKSGNNNNADQQDLNMQAKVRANILNGLSTVSFDGIDDFYNFTKVTDIRTVFWVINETDYSEPHFLLGDDQNYDFSRGMDNSDQPNGAFWHSIYTSNNIRTGSTFLNRNLVIDPFNEQLPTGRFNVVSMVTAGNVVANQLTRDRDLSGRTWKGDIAEIIIYNQPLSDNDRQMVENYLYNKWFAPPVTTYSLSGTISGAVKDGVRVSVDSSHSVISDASGNYKITNLQNGTYTVSATLSGYTFTPSSQQETISGYDISGIDFTATQAGGIGVSNPLDVAGCVMWLDGADPKNDGSAVSGTIDTWKNKADASKTPYQPDTAKQATVIQNALNGHSVLDFAAGSQTYDIIDSNLNKQNISATTFFWVLKENNIDKAHFFLGYLDTNDNTKTPFHRGITNDGAFAPDGKYWDDTYAADEVKNGQTFLDGAQIYGTSDVFPVGDFHIVSLVTTGPVDFNQITQDRYAIDDRSWDGQIAEIIAYNSPLNDSNRQAVENYLYNKWLANSSVSYNISGTVTENGSGLGGVTVSVDATHTAITEANGNFTINSVPEGAHTVTPMLVNYTFSPASASVSLSGGDLNGINFTASQIPPDKYQLTVNQGSGSGEYIENDSVNISASVPAAQIFDKWTGDVQFIADTTSATTTVTMPAQDITITATFKNAQPNTYSINGKITGDVIANVHIDINTGGSNLTKADGTYTISGLTNGTYTVTPYLQGYTFAPQNKSVTIQDSDKTGIDFVSSKIISTYTLTVNNGSGAGDYQGNTIVNISADTPPAGLKFDKWTGDTGNIADVTSASTTLTMPAQDITITATFKQIAPNTHNISGTVSGDVRQGITISAGGKSATTDASGNYTISGLVDGNYAVTPTLAGYTFSPAVANAAISGADVAGVNFTSIQNSSGGGVPTSISGCMLWLDGADPIANGSNVTGALQIWKDKSGNNNHAEQSDSAKQPSVISGGLNGKSVVSFDGTDDNFSFSKISNIKTVFWVLKEKNQTSDGSNLHFLLGDDGNYDFHRGAGTLWDDTYAADGIRNGVTRVDRVAFDGFLKDIPADKYVMISLVASADLTASQITMDRDIGRIWDGGIAEIIIYNHSLSDGERDTIENYLYNKWFWTPPATYSISGTVSGDVQQGVTISAGGKSATTDGNGNYTISGLADGNYTVTPTIAGYTFSPAVANAAVSGADVTGVNFTSIQNSSGGGIPTSISGCMLWLDGADPIANGSNVTGALQIWKDKSGNNNHAEQSDPIKQPSVISGGLNGKSVVSFDGTDENLSFSKISNIKTVFWVLKETNQSSDGSNLHFLLGDDGNYDFHRGAGTLWDATYAADGIINGATRVDRAAFDGFTSDIPANKYVLISLVASADLTASQITMDRDIGRMWDGGIAEIIIYNHSLSDGDRDTVENYLYNKWFGTPPPTHSISGTVSGDVQQGVTISVAGKSATTDANGNYTIGGLADGNYTVTPTLAGYTFNPATASAAVSGADVTGVNFTSASTAPQEYTLTVNNGTGGGQYSQGNTVSISTTVPDGQVFDAWIGDTQYLANANNASTTVTMPAQDITVTATFKQAPPVTHNISGTITGDIQQGVTISAGGKSATTDASGNYTINGLTDGNYTVTPELAGYTFSPAAASAAVSGADVTGVNFTSTQNSSGGDLPTSVSGCMLWLDGADPIANGSNVTGALQTWKDKSGNNNHAEQLDSAKQPSVVSGGLNGKSIVSFDGTDDNLLFSKISNIKTVFWVLKEKNQTSDGSNLHFLLGDDGNYDFHRGSGTLWDATYAADGIKNGATRVDRVAFDGLTADIPANKYVLISLVASADLTASQITMDRDIGRMWDGGIAEIIIYNHSLSDGDRNTVENYLYNKWFGTPPATHSISGSVSGDVRQGITISAGGKSATTDANGNYTISGLADGNYTVTPTLAGYTFNPATANAAVSGADLTGVNFTSASTAPQHYTLTVSNGTGGGQYSQGNTVYISATVPAGQVFNVWIGDTQYIANANNASTTLTMPAKNITITATFKQALPNTYSISGRVSGAVSEGVTVAVDAAHSAITDANGNYTISGLFNGNYTITPTITGYIFTPATTSITVNGNDVVVPGSFVSIDVNNNPPVAADDSYSIQQNGVLSVPVQSGLLANDIDSDGDNLIAIKSSDPQQGTLSLLSNGSFNYNAPANIGTYTFSYRANDGKVNSNTATVTITVVAGSTVPPTAVEDHYEIAQDSTNNIIASKGVLANDLNVTGLTPIILNDTVNGNLIFNTDGSFLYTPNDDFSGVDRFTYRITQGNYTSIAIVVLNVMPVKMAIGSILKYKASDVVGLNGSEFAKTPKLYGILESGKKRSFKKIKTSTPTEFSGVWSKRLTLYNRKAVKKGYRAYYISNGPDSPIKVKVTVKGKTTEKSKIYETIQTVQFVPPVITEIQDSIGNHITSASAGDTITIIGRFFGDKAPRVALEGEKGKLIKCKVDKSGLINTNYKGKPSAMNPDTGESYIKVILPKKKLPSRTYPIVLNNKIGIATTSGVNGKLPEITIK